MDYSNERGYVGTWKGEEVRIITKRDYDPYADYIGVIADDDMKMVRDGYVIGYLQPDGNVVQFFTKKRYKYEMPRPQKQKEEEQAITVAPGYFEQFSGVVDEFFSSLKILNID